MTETRLKVVVTRRLPEAVEARLSSVQQQMQDRLADNALRSQRALSEMQERMKESLHFLRLQESKNISYQPSAISYQLHSVNLYFVAWVEYYETHG